MKKIEIVQKIEEIKKEIANENNQVFEIGSDFFMSQKAGSKSKDDLEHELLSQTRRLESIRKEKSRKQQEESYWSSSEGIALRDTLILERNLLVEKLQNLQDETEGVLREKIINLNIPNFALTNLSKNYFVFSYYSEEKNERVFGTDIAWMKGTDGEWSTNIGSTGSFTASSIRADFYVQLGWYLSSEALELRTSIENIVDTYTSKIVEAHNEINKLDETFKNPLGLR